ncbi:MAG: hypothetical protein IT209_02105 [Armatimonadetes bacterium]|nr:hypothetical protein [Armatimonadota bacterium]
MTAIRFTAAILGWLALLAGPALPDVGLRVSTDRPSVCAGDKLLLRAALVNTGSETVRFIKALEPGAGQVKLSVTPPSGATRPYHCPVAFDWSGPPAGGWAALGRPLQPGREYSWVIEASDEVEGRLLSSPGDYTIRVSFEQRDRPGLPGMTAVAAPVSIHVAPRAAADRPLCQSIAGIEAKLLGRDAIASLAAWQAALHDAASADRTFEARARLADQCCSVMGLLRDAGVDNREAMASLDSLLQVTDRMPATLRETAWPQLLRGFATAGAPKRAVDVAVKALADPALTDDGRVHAMLDLKQIADGKLTGRPDGALPGALHLDDPVIPLERAAAALGVRAEETSDGVSVTAAGLAATLRADAQVITINGRRYPGQCMRDSGATLVSPRLFATLLAYYYGDPGAVTFATVPTLERAP